MKLKVSVIYIYHMPNSLPPPPSSFKKHFFSSFFNFLLINSSFIYFFFSKINFCGKNVSSNFFYFLRVELLFVCSNVLQCISSVENKFYNILRVVKISYH